MPVRIARDPENAEIARLRERRLRGGTIRDRGRRLRVELVNNMPDAAVFPTQRQFLRLLEEGAAAFDVTLGLTTLQTVARDPELKRDMAALYRSPSEFAASAPDAIIVTGAEPRAAELDEEPYWRELVEVFDFARARTFATLASCLAAHALVLRLDGVRRRRSPKKWSGLFMTEVVAEHGLTRGLEAGPTPHSRWNGLDEQDLTNSGYLVLTRATEAGVDMFVKDEEHLTLCFQGHPEYDGDTLAREYRRDASRAVSAAAAAPEPPLRYYPPELEARLRAHVAGMIAGAEAPHPPAEIMTAPEAGWRRRGGIVIGNWLTAAAARKTAANGPTYLRARWGG